MLRALIRSMSSPIFLRGESKSEMRKSKLANGVKLITESKRFPNSISLGIVLQVGIRNDPKGYLDLYKDLFLRSRSAVDQKAYSTLELAGCDINLLLERENLYFYTTCLEEHLQVVLPALKQSIFSNKLQMDTMDALSRLKIYLEPEKIEEKIKHMILTSAYKGKTLGIRHPKQILEDLNHSDYCDFIQKYFTADRVTIAACGVENHSAFELIVGQNFAEIPTGQIINEPGVYVGGVLRENLKDKMTHYTLGFNAGGLHDIDMPALNVLKSIIGDGGGFSTGGPGKGMHSRAYTSILPQGFIESVKTQYFSYSDSGVFAISLVGLENYAQYLPLVIVKELVDLMKIEQPELDRAKNIIIREAHINYQKTVSRLEDVAKNCSNFDMTPDEFGYLRKINEVTLAQIKQAIVRMLKSEFSVWTATNETTKLTDLGMIYKQLGK